MSRPLPLFALLLTCLATAAGCGGDGDKTAAEQDLEQTLTRFERAVATPTCKTLEPLIHSQYRLTRTTSPLSRSECRAVTQSFAKLGRLETGEYTVFGTGAVVDNSVEGRNQSAVFVRDVDGDWKFVVLLPAQPQVGSQPVAQAGFDLSARSVVSSFKMGDCRMVGRLVALTSPLAQLEGPGFCRDVLGTPEEPTPLRGRLMEDRTPKRVGLGATRDFAFYSLRTGEDAYDTIVMVTQPSDAPRRALREKEPYALYDVLRGPPSRR